VFRSKAEKKVVEAGYDPARLPPGQYFTAKWPVLHAGSAARYDDLATWTLRVFGEVENEIELTWEQLDALPRSSNTQDIHCVTRWSRFDAQFEGVHWRELAKLAQPKPTARFVIAHAEAGFTSNVPVESGFTIAKPGMLVVNGTTLPRVTVRLPPFALPALSTATRYWPGKERSLVPRPVLSEGMFAITNFASSGVPLIVAFANTVNVPWASAVCRFGV